MQAIPDLEWEQNENDMASLNSNVIEVGKASISEELGEDEQADTQQASSNNILVVEYVGKDSTSKETEDDEQIDSQQSSGNSIMEVNSIAKDIDAACEETEQDKTQTKPNDHARKRKNNSTCLHDSLSVKERVYGKRQRKPRTINE